MKWILSLLIVLLLSLQYKLWVGDGSVPQLLHLQEEVKKQQHDKKKLEDRNAALTAEVADLKKGYNAIEERARSELGMLGKGEVFFQIIPPSE
ncbi:Cell division protein DivIC (FtsB), stabilizes FtsL against RasP cleavage [hydrothermal vent metagenome]|uniref:Cell division protein DivIC (FtsB), stabilizes FtsL against RasP cleavage n=1 Tax=hydrothermal vent metagenome TaxID=652676 RepID=A0A3B0XMG0_9ZZZZ